MSERHFSPAEAARRLGVSVKALRVYESHGLVKPLRTAADWRTYGPNEIVRLHQIVALKRLGLSLARIGQPAERQRFAGPGARSAGTRAGA